MVVGGFANDIHMLVAVRNDGTVTGVSILDSHETYGLGQEAKGDWDFLIDMLNSQGDLAVNSNIDSITRRYHHLLRRCQRRQRRQPVRARQRGCFRPAHRHGGRLHGPHHR